ncbi:MAG TPA: XRE family transcriptional regulator [Dehalococcoidia bacterium]|nr:XRE family transcriptional regulator [Dehalococcoidia bacterium]
MGGKSKLCDNQNRQCIKMGPFMRISIPGLGGRLRRARNGTGLSQEAVAERIGVSWMTVHRWERSQRAVPDYLLDKLCDLYDKPLRWFLTLEEGDLEQENGPADGSGKVSDGSGAYNRKAGIGTDAAGRVYRQIADAPSNYIPLIEKVVEDILDGLKANKR